MAFIFLHFIIVLLQLPDLAGLLLLALPVILFIGYCTHNSARGMLRSALLIYASFSAVLIASAVLVYLIG